MRLGVNLGYWGAGNDADNLVLAREADRLGYSVCWVAEAYGSDAPTVLAWVAAQTRSIDIGAAVMQIPARTPAMTAMTAATLDTLSGGRFRLGLGISGPQVSEGWHGVRFAKPLGRTREYVEIVRKALRRERLEYQGEHWTLPLPDGPGKPIKLTVHPVREEIPIYLASVGPKNLELTGRIADGWLAIFFAPEHAALSLDPLRAGREQREDQTGDQSGDQTRDQSRDQNSHTAIDIMEGFDVVPTVPMMIDDDLEAAAAPLRAYASLYLGGMGSREQNFYNALAVRMGFEAEAAKVQDLYLGKDYEAAAHAVPFDFIDQTALIGPVDRIRDRMQAYADAGVTTLTISPWAATLEGRIDTLRRAGEALEAAGLAG
jgi:F420-dependent oxidoreductase-like protein